VRVKRERTTREKTGECVQIFFFVGGNDIFEHKKTQLVAFFVLGKKKLKIIFLVPFGLPEFNKNAECIAGVADTIRVRNPAVSLYV